MGHTVNHAAYRIVSLLIFASIYASTAACLWFNLACIKLESVSYFSPTTTNGEGDALSVCSPKVLTSWISNDEVIVPAHTLSAYLRSLHFVMQTLFTVGFGDIWPVSSEEFGFALVMIMISSLFYAVLISSITSLLANRKVTTKKFRKDLDVLKRYLSLRHCPKALLDRIREFQEFLFTRQYGLQEHTFLDCVPRAIVYDIKRQCGGEMLRRVPFFKRQSDYFLQCCVERLTFRCYAPGNFLYRQEEKLRELIIVRSGRVDILVSDNVQALFTLVTGDHTGDFQLLFGTPAEFSAQANGYLETMVLTWDAFTVALALSGLGVGLSHGFKWGHGVHPASLTDGGPSKRTSFVRKSKKSVDSHLPAPEEVIVRPGATAGLLAPDLQQKVLKFDEFGCALGNQGDGADGDAPSTATYRAGNRLSFKVPCARTDHAAPAIFVNTSHSSKQATEPCQRGRPGRAAPLKRSSAVHGACVDLNVQQHLKAVAMKDLCAEIEASGRQATWVDFHKGALQATADAHRDLLVKLVKAQSSIDRAHEKKGRHKRMFDMMLTEAMPLNSKHGCDGWLVVTPDQSLRLWWDAGVLLTMLYYIVGTPIALMVQSNCLHDTAKLPDGVLPNTTEAYATCFSRWEYTLILDYLLDFFMIFDLVARSRYFSFREFDEERDCTVTIDSPAEIWRARRRRPGFRMSVLLAFPYDFFALLTGYLRVFRLVKMLYIVLIPSIIGSIQLFLDKERNLTISGESVTVVHLALATVTMIVWMSCAWSFLSHEDQEESSWIASFYWCLTTMTTVGYGDIHPLDLNQTWFFILSSMVGPALSATIIGNVSSYMHSVDVSTDCVQHRRMVCNRWLSANGLDERRLLADPILMDPSSPRVDTAVHPSGCESSSGALATKASPVRQESSLVETSEAFFDFLLNDLGGIHEEDILPLRLPPPLIEEVRSSYMHKLVSNIPVFERLDKTSLHEVIQAVQVRVFTKRTFLLDSECPADGIYIILKGVVNVHERRQRSITQRSVGEYLAEEALLSELTVNPYVARASTDCEVLYLSRVSFSGIIRQCPSLCDQLPYMRAVCSKTGRMAKNLAKNTKDTAKALLHLQETRERNRLFVRPDGLFIKVWSGIVVLCTLYSAISLPVRLAFLEGHTVTSPYAKARTSAWTFLAMDYVGDLCFMVDIVLRLRFLSFFVHSDLIMVRTRITRHYIDQGAFWAHLVAAVPLDLLVLFTGPFGAAGLDLSQTLCCYRLNRLMRLVDINEHWTVVECALQVLGLTALNTWHELLPRKVIMHLLASLKHIKYYALGRDAEGASGGGCDQELGEPPSPLLQPTIPGKAIPARQSPKTLDNPPSRPGAGGTGSKVGSKWKNALGIAKLIAVILFTAHCSGCIFFMIANSLHWKGNRTNWADTHNLLRLCSFGALGNVEMAEGHDSSAGRGLAACPEPVPWSMVGNQYMHSLYWATCVMFTVGYGDVVPVANEERLFNILLFFVGTCVFAMVIVYVNDIVCQLDVTSDIFKIRLHRLKAFVKRLELGHDGWTRVLTYYQRLWTQHKGASGEELRRFLPGHIYGQAVETVLPLGCLNSLYFVKNCSQNFKQAFASKMLVRLYQRDDTIFSGGEAASTLFILVQGSVTLRAHIDSSKSSPGGVRKNNRRASTLRKSRRMSSLPNNGQRKTAASNGQVITSITEGTLGAYEFFLRDSYSCTAVASADITMLEIDFSNFWGLVADHRLEEEYRRIVLERAYSVAAASVYGEITASTLATVALATGCDKDGSMEFLKLQQSSTFWMTRSVQANLGSSKMTKMYAKEKEAFEDDGEGVILPDSVIAAAWNALQALLLLYIAFTVPYVLAFGVLPNPTSTATTYYAQLNGRSLPTIVVFDIVAVIISATDVYLRAYWLSVKDEEGEPIVNMAVCRRIYRASSEFPCDLLSATPFPLMALLAPRSITAWRLYSYLRALLCVRLVRTPRVASSLLTTVEVLRGKNVDANLLRITQFVFLVWCYVHTISCVMCAVGLHEAIDDRPSWVIENGFDSLQYSELYLRGYFWAAYTVITVGYGSIGIASNLERVLALVGMTFGAIICNAGIAAVFSSIISNYDDAHGRARRIHEACLQFCRSHKIDGTTQQRLKTYYRHLSCDLDCHDVQGDIELLPPILRREHMYMQMAPALKRILFLKDVVRGKAGGRAYGVDDLKEENESEDEESKSRETSKAGTGCIGATNCPLSMQREGLVHTLVKLAECATYVCGQVIVPVQEIGAEGWHGDLNVLHNGSCTMLVGPKGALTHTVAALSSSCTQGDTFAGNSLLHSRGAIEDAIGSDVAQTESVLQCSVAPGEPLLAEALEKWRLVPASSTPASPIGASSEKTDSEKVSGGIGSLAATIVGIETFEDISVEEYRGMSIILSLYPFMGEDPSQGGLDPPVSAFTLTPSQTRVMPVGAAYAELSSSIEITVHRGCSSTSGSSAWGSVKFPLGDLDSKISPASSANAKEHSTVAGSASVAFHGTESEEGAALSVSKKPESTTDDADPSMTPWREAKPRVVPVTDSISSCTATATATATTCGENQHQLGVSGETVPSFTPAQKRPSMLAAASSEARRRMSSMLTVVSPAALLGSMSGAMGIDEEETDEDNDDVSDYDSDERNDDDDDDDDDDSTSTLSEEGSTHDSITTCEDATPIDSAASGGHDESSGPRCFVLHDDRGVAVGRVKVVLRYSPPVLAKSNACPMASATAGGSHLIAALGNKERTPLSYAVVATSLCLVHQIPSSHLHEVLSFYRSTQRSPTARLANIDAQGDRRRVSVMRVATNKEKGRGNGDDDGFSGGAAVSRRNKSRCSVNGITGNYKRASKSASRQSTTLSISLNSAAIGDGVMIGGQSALELTPSHAANSEEYGQSSVDVAAARFALRQGSMLRINRETQESTDVNSDEEETKNDSTNVHAGEGVGKEGDRNAMGGQSASHTGDGEMLALVPPAANQVQEEEEEKEEEEEETESQASSRRGSISTSTGPSTGSFSPRGNSNLVFALEDDQGTDPVDYRESGSDASAMRELLGGTSLHSPTVSRAPGEPGARRFSVTHQEIGLSNIVTKLHANGQAI